MKQDIHRMHNFEHLSIDKQMRDLFTYTCMYIYIYIYIYIHIYIYTYIHLLDGVPCSISGRQGVELLHIPHPPMHIERYLIVTF
jgi:hypothetical protein